MHRLCSDAWRLTVCLRMLSRGRNMLSDPPSISEDSDLRCLDDCVLMCVVDSGIRT